MKSGASSFSTLRRIWTKPKTALVGSPFEFDRLRMAKKARKMLWKPSIRTSLGRRAGSAAGDAGCSISILRSLAQPAGGPPATFG